MNDLEVLSLEHLFQASGVEGIDLVEAIAERLRLHEAAHDEVDARVDRARIALGSLERDLEGDPTGLRLSRVVVPAADIGLQIKDRRGRYRHRAELFLDQVARVSDDMADLAIVILVSDRRDVAWAGGVLTGGDARNHLGLVGSERSVPLRSRGGLAQFLLGQDALTGGDDAAEHVALPARARGLALGDLVGNLFFVHRHSPFFMKRGRADACSWWP